MIYINHNYTNRIHSNINLAASENNKDLHYHQCSECGLVVECTGITDNVTCNGPYGFNIHTCQQCHDFFKVMPFSNIVDDILKQQHRFLKVYK
jgi:hypothetical protein